MRRAFRGKLVAGCSRLDVLEHVDVKLFFGYHNIPFLLSFFLFPSVFLLTAFLTYDILSMYRFVKRSFRLAKYYTKP